jgi:hypothetical protein
VLSTAVVIGIVSVAVGWKAAASAACTSGSGALRTKVASSGRSDTPSLTSVTSISPTLKR